MAITPKTPKINQPGKKAAVPDMPNFEQETSKEVQEYHAKLRAATQAEQQGIDNATSTGFWIAVYFADTAQRDEFVRNAGLDGSGIGQYYNGEKVAKTLGVKITPKKIEKPKVFRQFKKFKHFT